MRAGLSSIKTSIKKSHHGPQYVSALCVVGSVSIIVAKIGIKARGI